MKKILFALLPVLLLATGCGSTFRVYQDLDTSTDFGQYETYSFLDWTEGNKKTINGMERERIRAGFARELEKMGLTYDEENADLKVKITVYFREATHPQYNYGGYGYYRPYPYPYYSQYHYIERALTVDIFDAVTQKQVWYSAAVGEVGRSPESRARHLPRQVTEMLEGLPLQQEPE